MNAVPSCGIDNCGRATAVTWVGLPGCEDCGAASSHAHLCSEHSSDLRGVVDLYTCHIEQCAWIGTTVDVSA